MHGDRSYRRSGEAAAAGAEDRPALRGVDAHAKDGVDRGESVGAGLLDRPGDRNHVGGARRELHDDRQVRRLADRARHLRRERGILTEEQAALHVRARDVELERHDARRLRERLDDEDVVVDAVSRDVHDHRDAQLRPLRSVDARDLCRAGVLQADRVEDARGRLGDPVLRVARPRVARRSLVDIGVYEGQLIVVDAVDVEDRRQVEAPVRLLALLLLNVKVTVELAPADPTPGPVDGPG